MPDSYSRDQVQESSTLTEQIVSQTDVLYVTRVQKERFASLEEYTSIAEAYNVNASKLQSLSESSVILHPLPRVNELSTDCDMMPQAKYFEQMRCGMVIRMALLILMLGREHLCD